MKSKNSFVIIPLVLALVACVPVFTPAPANTPVFAVTSTSTQFPATLTPQPIDTLTESNISTSTPLVNEKGSEDCFLSVDFIPQKTELNEVISSWGQPSSRESYGDYEDWYFDVVGTPRIHFNKQVLDTVDFSLKNCPLEKIFTKLGHPEKVEVAALISCIGAPTTYLQSFHYQSLGYSFYRSCEESQNCFIFHAADSVFGKEFYSPNKVIEDSTGFNTARYVYTWHGFDVDVEKIENKIKDFVSPTPTP